MDAFREKMNSGIGKAVTGLSVGSLIISTALIPVSDAAQEGKNVIFRLHSIRVP